jgi:hypothetical protein
MPFDLTVDNDSKSIFFIENRPDERGPDDTLTEFDITSIETETAPDESDADEESIFQSDD